MQTLMDLAGVASMAELAATAIVYGALFALPCLAYFLAT